MTRIIAAVIAVLAWGAIGLLEGAGELAYLRAEFAINYRDPAWAAAQCISVPYKYISLGPIGFLLGAVTTQGFKNGFTLSCEPTVRKT